MNKIPRITITESDGGWLIACAACRWETYAPRRPGADRAAHDHQKNHKENT